MSKPSLLGNQLGRIGTILIPEIENQDGQLSLARSEVGILLKGAVLGA